MAASAVLLTGNNFSKVDMFCRTAGLGMPTTQLFYNVQNLYLVKVIEEKWEELNKRVRAKYNNGEVQVIGNMFLLK